MASKNEKGPALTVDKQSLLTRIIVVNSAASAAEFATFPLDFAKTQMQLAQRSISMQALLTDFIHVHGIRSVYNGISPGILRHWVYSPLRILVYESLRSLIPDESATFAVLCLVGMTTGAMGQFIASPTDLLKVRMMADTARREGQPRQYAGMTDCIRQMYRAGGLKCFWMGWQPNVLRAMLVNTGELAVYDSAKQYFLARNDGVDGIFVHTQSAFTSGLAAAVLSTPADVIKSRVMASGVVSGTGAPTTVTTSFRDIVAVVKDTYKKGGLGIFYRGFLPAWIRLAPWQFVFWITYEQMRKVVGFAGFAAPPSLQKHTRPNKPG